MQIKHLKEKGFVVEDEKRHLQLTERGESVAQDVLKNRRVFIAFLMEVLGLPGDVAETDACKIEHLLSHETTDHLITLLQLLHSDEPEAKDLRKRLKGFEIECPTLEHCGICEDECLVEVEPHLRDPSAQ